MIWQSLLTIGILVILEGLLSFDNALALAAMVKGLPQSQQKKALVYGIWGAFSFRFLALTILTYLLRSIWVKFAGGGYLLWMAYQFFFGGEDEEPTSFIESRSNFWRVVLLVELTDITFSMDSILASVAVSQKLAIVFSGGILGILMMRFVSSLFIKLIDVFPRLETSAYFLILAVGVKLIAEGFTINFDQLYPAVVFWSVMGISFLYGFTKRGAITVTFHGATYFRPGDTVLVTGSSGKAQAMIVDSISTELKDGKIFQSEVRGVKTL